MIISNDKYKMSETTNSYYSIQMRLTVKSLFKSDMGGYKCISKNSIGDAEGNIRLYGKFPGRKAPLKKNRRTAKTANRQINSLILNLSLGRRAFRFSKRKEKPME